MAFDCDIMGATSRGFSFLTLVCFLWITEHYVAVKGCYINDCQCYQQRITCEMRDQATPRFTLREVFVTQELYITSKQTSWISTACGLFPRLRAIVMMDDSKCPALHCVPCR